MFYNSNKFLDVSKKICKKHLPNFIESNNLKLNFKKKKGSFFDIPCLIPSGEEEEILLSLIRKMK